MRDGARVQVVGVVVDGKYASFADAPKPAMFLPIVQSPSNASWLVMRATGDPQQLATAVRSTLRDLDAGLPVTINTWKDELNSGTALFGPRMATASLGALGVMGAMLSVTG